MHLTIDFETRSRVNLKEAGAWRYAEDPSTEVICLAVKCDDRPARIFVADEFANRKIMHGDMMELEHKMVGSDVIRLIRSADIIEAHNVSFERAIWYHICHKRWGWPELPAEKCRCSMAKCAANGLPHGLGDACRQLGLVQEKDDAGHRLMLKMCKPRKPSKHNKAEWFETSEQIRRLCEYCQQDVEAEYCLSSHLPDLSPSETELFLLP